jgi:hypothetical protein
MSFSKVGQILNVGPGAGSRATASAIVADIVDLGRGNELPTFTVANRDLVDVNHLPMSEHECEFYIRLASVLFVVVVGVVIVVGVVVGVVVVVFFCPSSFVVVYCLLSFFFCLLIMIAKHGSVVGLLMFLIYSLPLFVKGCRMCLRRTSHRWSLVW